MTKPAALDSETPVWTADTEALANCLWRLIQIHRHGRAPAIRPPESASGVPPSGPIAPEGAGE